MDALFPLNKNVKKKKLSTLVIAILLYVVLSVIVGLIQWLLRGIPVVNTVMNIVGYLVWLYSVVGVILAIFKFVK
ncbi:MAG TPA: hypothetical protein PKJ65_06120 [Clostridia bacterium]|jgi:hypothetical protein|nr:MAG: hypothetical protein BWX78_01365 [Firmicutes bacterium ADurb.Bin099]HNZ41445.1 hypothetical protein [Clostridia bacterium]HOF27581.1 hypothetical protein [Clostridia bacterium]HPL08948.1 hypothetical protein [Clostridia bacterium]HPY98407.1 hypothetical protein [Clostridia bacterium]